MYNMLSLEDRDITATVHSRMGLTPEQSHAQLVKERKAVNSEDILHLFFSKKTNHK